MPRQPSRCGKHFLLPKDGPTSLRRIACHLKAGGGQFTEDPDRVTCHFCLNKQEYQKVRLKILADHGCTCSHRRGKHLGKEGTGRCIECVECLGFTRKVA